MTNNINWEEYNIRTLAYYQKQGGVYSDLITVLQKARTDKSILSYIPTKTPARLLNIASYVADLAMADKENSAQVIAAQKWQYASRLKDDQYLVFSIVYLLIGDTDCEGANSQLMRYIGTSKIYTSLLRAYRKVSLKSGMPLLEVMSSEERKRLEEALRAKDEIIDSLKTTIASLSSHIDEMQSTIDRLAQEKDSAQASALGGSQLDKTLTLDFIIDQIEHRRTYGNSYQIIDLLKGKLMRIATDEEVAKIEQMEQRMLDASVPTIHNDIKESQVFQAPIHNPSFQLPIGFTEDMLRESIEQYLEVTSKNGHQNL